MINKETISNKILSVIVVISIFIFLLIGVYDRISNIQSFNIQDYNVVNDNIKHAEVINIQTEFNMECDFVFYGFKDQQVQTLVKTSSESSGIRVSLINASFNGIWAIEFPNGDVKVIYNVPSPNIKHHLAINVSEEEHKCIVALDDVIILNDSIDNASINCDNVVLGNVEAGDCKFNGKITNFKLNKNKYSNGLNNLKLVFLVLISISILWILINYIDIKVSEIKINNRQLLLVVSFIFILIALIRGSQNYIPWDKYYFITGYIIAILASFILHIKSGQKKLHYVGAIAAIVIIMKGFYIHMSFYGAVSDLFLAIFILTVTQYIIRFVSKKFNLKHNLLSAIGSILGAASIFFITMGALYIHYIQKAAEPTTLFGEEAQAIFQSNISEMYEFVLSVFSQQQIIIGIGVFIISAVFLYKLFSVKSSEKLVKSNYVHMGLLGIIAIISTYIAGIGQSLAAPVMELANAYHNSVIQMEEYQKLRKENSNLTATKIGNGETYVVVLGESGNRRHYGAYSYFRNTTPWMSDLREDGHTIFMENAYASFVHTVPSMLNMLTSASQYNDQVNFAAPSIIEVAKAAGFKTYWFSNQHRYGLIDNPLTVLAEEADEVHFTAKSGLDTDDKLISLVDKYTKNINPDENNLIIIHLMGSHARYKDRLPKGTDIQWKETGISYMGDYAKDGDLVNDVNAYDKTIQKDDEIMKAIYDNISAKVSDISAFIFIPDHGEDVYGKKHHDSSQFNWEMARVPFVMLFSDKWIDKNFDRFNVLKDNVEKPFTSDLFYDYLAGIMGINSDSVDKSMDISDPKFSLSWDNAMTMKTNNTLQTQFYSKSQAHMLNEDPEYQVKKNIAYLNSLGDDSRFLGVCNDTVGRGLKTLSLGFNGIEVNVTPTENGIMMGHGPEVILDITLDEYLSYMPMDKIKKIWLDVKMDDPALIDKAFRDFEKIDKKYHIKDKSIFECYLSDEKMSMFADNGWQLTYYIHFRFNNVGVEFPKAVKDLIQNESGTPRRYNVSSIEEKEEINRFTIALAKSIKRQKSVNVSFWGEMFSYLDEDLYPLLGNGYGFCTWAVPEIPQLTDIDFTDKINKNYPPILNFSGNIKSILVESNVDYRSF